MTTQYLSPDLADLTSAPNLAARRAVRAGCFGFFVDMFEVYLPIAVLAPALEYFIPAGLSGANKATIFSVVFAISLMGRPIGSMIFGHFGDRLGRRRITLISVAAAPLPPCWSPRCRVIGLGVARPLPHCSCCAC